MYGDELLSNFKYEGSLEVRCSSQDLHFLDGVTEYCSNSMNMHEMPEGCVPPTGPSWIWPRLFFILERCMTILSGVFLGASSKSVSSMAFAFKHAVVCPFAPSMTEHAWCSLRGGQTLRWHLCHDRQTLWVSLPLSACALYDHMDPGPDGACRGEWVCGGGAGPLHSIS